MLVLVCYDVSTETQAGRRRLRQVARACQDHGVRVQFSVFECTVDPAQWTALRARLLGIIDERTDSLRFYRLGSNARHRAEHVGAKPPTDLEAPLIV
ncbi:MAG TPA: CRISPR-associated endonuclease Cas2 [Azospirillaceae bacterium]|nr:CRISPR-associated endonuclease Cas2 [Azospirillaceae bacterium]